MKKFTLLIAALLCSITISFAYDTEIDGIYYNLNRENMTAEVTFKSMRISGSYPSGDVSNYTLSEVTLPSIIIYNNEEYTVTSIGDYAFAVSPSLKEVTFSNTITRIGKMAFFVTSIPHITIPSSVTYIGESAFHEEGPHFTKVFLEAYTPPALEENAFDFYATTFYIPDNTLSAYQEAWGTEYKFISNENTLTINVEIPGTLSDLIFEAGYRPVNIAKLTVTGTLNYDDFTYMRENMSALVDVDLSGISNTSGVNFNGKTNLHRIILPNNLEKIDNQAFYNCSELTTIDLPNSITEIGSEAFYETGLTSIKIPEGVTIIGGSAFWWSNLHYIEIPKTVTSIGGFAFAGCYNVQVHISDIKAWCNINFYGHDYYANPLQNNGILYLNGEKVTDLVIPNDVNSIGTNAFYGYNSLKSVVIPNSVKYIGPSAFDGCSSLTSVSLSDKITIIEESTFANCSSLKSITIPYGVEEVRQSAFSNTDLDTIICLAGLIPCVGYLERFVEFLGDFENFDPKTCQLKVPAELYDDYIYHKIWGKFVNIDTMNIDYHKITVKSNDLNMGYVNIRQSSTYHVANTSRYYLPNDTVKLEAIPLEYTMAEAGEYIYYRFKQWSDGSTENPRVFVATEDVTLTAEFIIPPCEVTLVCDEAQGTVTGGGEYEQGTQVTLTAQPNIGYKFSYWDITTYEPFSYNECYENPYTFEIQGLRYYIQAVFEQSKVEVNGLYYYLRGDTAIVTSSDAEGGYNGNIVIPEVITIGENRYIVAEIGSYAFRGSNITSVNIPASVNYIGGAAFANCNSLQIVKFNNSTPPMFGRSVFSSGYYNKRIIVPCGAIETYENAFGTSEYWYFTDAQYMISVSANNENCYAEIQDNISCDDNEATIYASSYSDSYLFKQWSDGNTDNPRIVTVTSDTTFVAEFNHCYTIETYYNYEQGTATGSGKYTESDTAILVAIPNIGYEFDYWNVYIYNQYGWGYEYIGSTTGDTIKLTNIDNIYAYEAIFKVVPVLIDGIYYELKPNLTAYVYPHEYTGDIVIPSNVVYKDKNYDVAQIYEDAFTGTSITSLSVSNGLNSIDLSGCDNLVALKGNIDFIGACSGLNSLKGLKEIYVTSGTLATGDVVYFNFLNLLQIPTLEVLDLSKVENTELSPEMFKETYVDVFNEYYGGRLHLSLKNLRKLVLPEGLTMIHDRQFEGLWMLEEIVIPDGVTEIPDGAFYDCHALANIEFSKNLTSIGKYAFYSCHALENIVIPEGVTEIGDAAFYGCNYADEIVIASSVQRIGNNAFALCNQVERMEVHATIPPSIRAKTFYQVNRNIEFVVPAEARNAYAEDIYWREFIQEVPTDVETTTTNSLVVYTQGGMIYVEGVETDYNIFDASGRLVYSGRESVLSLPRGVYMVVVGDEVEKIVL